MPDADAHVMTVLQTASQSWKSPKLMQVYHETLFINCTLKVMRMFNPS